MTLDVIIHDPGCLTPYGLLDTPACLGRQFFTEERTPDADT